MSLGHQVLKSEPQASLFHFSFLLKMQKTPVFCLHRPVSSRGPGTFGCLWVIALSSSSPHVAAALSSGLHKAECTGAPMPGPTELSPAAATCSQGPTVAPRGICSGWGIPSPDSTGTRVGRPGEGPPHTGRIETLQHGAGAGLLQGHPCPSVSTHQHGPRACVPAGHTPGICPLART